ncbi:hypothetical protein Dtox_2080 [Desulfofarcimen acetoxidans DSM 771]|uniref:Uncharacterized protein n=1 Tax=Desulfofarcimen acetoxidans (strain ATCC 49208 / DSM 771 / KCTC 5769 / VKM B-1644 / 5575) TaxID=485916 RepID=C8VYZ9_DESAS|nr:hypothetical protein [Desulfofarcimen acetoxidans]ACV62909.1 hypothetical protein Dtox_2080 [Desulfofarcimen acetoxidans DSM 771]
MSCKNDSNSGNSITVAGKQVEIKELVKASSLEEANNMLKKGYIFVSVYWNTLKSSEEYIFGRLDVGDKPQRRVGFLQD